MRKKKWYSGVALGTAAVLALSGLATAPAFAAEPGGSNTGTGYNGTGDVQPSLTVSPAENINPEGDSVLTLEGENYAVANDAGSNVGGAYLLFGVIDPKDENDPGSWAPTKRGVSGVNYDYAPDAGVYQSMINYPGNDTEPGLGFMDGDGNFSTTLTIPGAQFSSQAGNEINCLEDGVQCGVITVGAHGQRSSGVEVFTPVNFSTGEEEVTISTQPSDVSVEEGEDATFTIAVEGDAEAVIQWQSRENAEGTWADIDGATGATLTVEAAELAANGTQYRAVVNGAIESTEATLTVTEAEEAEEPSEPAEDASVGTPFEGNTAYMTVTPGKDLSTTETNNLVIEGHGYDSSKAIYVGIGTNLNQDDPEQWRKSKGGLSGPDGDFDYGSPRLVVAKDSEDAEFADAEMDADGNWTLNVALTGTEVASFFGGGTIDCEANQCGVFSFGAHGKLAAENEAYTEISFAEEVVIPSYTVSPTEVPATGGTINVKGENVDTSARPAWGDTSSPAGLYVSLGWISDNGWKPSENAAADTRKAVYTKWVQATTETDGDQYVQWTENEDGTANFEFDFEDIDYDTVYEAKPAEGDYSLAVTVIGAGGVKQAINEFAEFVTVQAPPAVETSLSVAAQEVGEYATDFAGEDVTVNAQVTPANATGSVEFFAGETSLGSADVTEGVATIATDKFTGGAHQVTAKFTPAGNFTESTSGEQTFRIVDLAPAVGEITVGDQAKEIKNAELTWSVANYVSFGAGPGKEVLGGNVELVDGEFLFTEGVGKEDADGNREISFEGDIRLTSGTMPEWNFSNPTVYVNAAGDGYIEATIDGAHYMSQLGMEDSTYGPERAVVQTFKGSETADEDGVSSFTVAPLFEGQVAAGTWLGDYTGATLTNQFLQHVNSFVRSYFLQSGSGSDSTKAGTPITVAYEAGNAPAIATQPQDVTVEAGANAAFSVEVTENADIVWQTQSENGEWIAIDGATGAELNLNEVELTDDGTQFRAVASNNFGEAVSEVATLVVHPAGEPEAPELTDENQGDLTIVSQDGLNVTLNAGEGNENSWVGATLHSDPQFLGWFKTDADGNFTVTAPDGTEGDHSISAVNATGDMIGWVAVTFATADNGGTDNSGDGAANTGTNSGGNTGTHSGGDTGDKAADAAGLATTGSESLPMIALALLLAAAGAVTLVARRRQNV
ncbi:MAG: Ig-like domain repeat protein [Canibacter sp.]